MTDSSDLDRDLVPGELSPLTRLRPLGHLDLELESGRQILRRHPEASRGYLFEETVSPVAVRLAVIARWVLTAFTAAAFCPQTVHTDGYGLMCLTAKRAVGHGTRREAFSNFLNWLHLLDGDRLCGLEAQKIADGGRRTLVHGLGISLVILLCSTLDQLMHALEDVRVKGMILTVLTETVDTLLLESRFFLAKGGLMKTQDLLGNLFQSDSIQTRRRASEILIDDRLSDP